VFVLFSYILQANHLAFIRCPNHQLIIAAMFKT